MISLQHPILAGLCALAVVGGAMLMRRRLSGQVLLLLLAGGLCLAAAAGTPSIGARDASRIVVCVDVSPSTRTAEYRSRAQLQQRLDALLGNRPYRIEYFPANPPSTSTDMIADAIGVEKTTFTPPADADAMILLSDGQFEAPAVAPPVYPVIDSGLLAPADARVATVQAHPDHVAMEVSLQGAPRQLHMEPVGAHTTITQSQTIIEKNQSGHSYFRAAFEPGDAWPENDAMSVAAAPPIELERWWIGNDSSAGWRPVAPSDAPTGPAPYGAVGVVAITSHAANALSLPQQRQLASYVEDLGGSLILFEANSDAITRAASRAISEIAPLSSTPPEPVSHWIVFLDASGSMATNARFELAAAAVRTAIGHLPPNDHISIGAFARNVAWWTSNSTIEHVATQALPPEGSRPGGPTNLLEALRVATDADSSLPSKQLLVITDGGAKVTAADIRGAIGSHPVRLHVLALGDGPAIEPLRDVSASTSGVMVTEADAASWASAARHLTGMAAGASAFSDAAQINFLDSLHEMNPGPPLSIRRMWLKSGATLWARAGDLPAIAHWQAGAGRVTSVAFAASPELINRLAKLTSAPPRDERFVVSWRDWSVDVSAMEQGRPINGLKLSLNTAGSPPVAFQQTAPGRYECPPAREAAASFATIRTSDGSIVDRRVLPSRCPQEFDRIGLNLENLGDLALRTGGQVIEPTTMAPIDITHAGGERRDVAHLAGIGGSFLLGVALIRWRRGT